MILKIDKGRKYWYNPLVNAFQEVNFCAEKKITAGILLIGIIVCAGFSVWLEKVEKNDPENMDLSMTVTPVCSTISAVNIPTLVTPLSGHFETVIPE